MGFYNNQSSFNLGGAPFADMKLGDMRKKSDMKIGKLGNSSMNNSVNQALDNKSPFDYNPKLNTSLFGNDLAVFNRKSTLRK